MWISTRVPSQIQAKQGRWEDEGSILRQGHPAPTQRCGHREWNAPGGLITGSWPLAQAQGASRRLGLADEAPCRPGLLTRRPALAGRPIRAPGLPRRCVGEVAFVAGIQDVAR